MKTRGKDSAARETGVVIAYVALTALLLLAVTPIASWLATAFILD